LTATIDDVYVTFSESQACGCQTAAELVVKVSEGWLAAEAAVGGCLEWNGAGLRVAQGGPRRAGGRARARRRRRRDAPDM
jgi:hypothetical protein